MKTKRKNYEIWKEKGTGQMVISWDEDLKIGHQSYKAPILPKFGPVDRQKRRDAEKFMMRAVNSHEALLAMLKKVLRDGTGIHYEEIGQLIKQAEGL